MKQLVKFSILFMVSVSITLLNSPIYELDFKVNNLSSLEHPASSIENSPFDSDSEDDANEIEFHDTEYFAINLVAFVPKTLNLTTQDDSTVLISSYIFSIFIPPLFNVLS